MSNSTSNLILIQTAQAQKEVTANALALASSPATAYARIEQQSAAFAWAYYGATILVGGAPTQVAGGTLTLTANATVYIEAKVTGEVTQNNVGWTPGRIPLYKVTTGSNGPTSWIDMRAVWRGVKQMATLTVTGDTAFQNAESNCDIVKLTGTPSAAFNVTIPAGPWEFAIINATGQDAKLSTGTAAVVTVGAGKAAKVIADGTDVLRLTADA